MPNKIALFIDYSNFLSSSKKIGCKIEFSNILKYIEQEFGGKLVFKGIYMAYPSEGTREYDLSPRHKFAYYLEAGLGFYVAKKPLKRIKTDDGGILEKGNMDIELTIDVMKTSNTYDTIVLFSGDSDFSHLLSHLQGIGKKGYVFSTTGNISRELISTANGYYDIAEELLEFDKQMKNPNC